MFNKNESVVVKRNSGSTHSGRVVKQIDDDHYKVAYIHWLCPIRRVSQ